MQRQAQRPNIIVLILDAVRAKNLSAYGHSTLTTPHLDAFAQESVLFRRAFAPATWTIPTHASILSGLYLSQHRIENINSNRQFHEGIVTLPQALHKTGYRTAAFSSNILFSPRHFLDKGFDEFHELDNLMESQQIAKLVKSLSDQPAGFGRQPARYARKSMTPRLLLDAVNQWLRQQDDGRTPLFTVINLANVHYPWAVPPDLLLKNFRFNPKYLLQQEFASLDPFAFNSGRRQVSDLHREIWQTLYNAALIHVDREVGRFLKAIPQRQNSVIAITADHGEMLGEYRDIVGHTLTLHDNITHVPLIVHHPHYPAGLQVERVVQNLDLYASVLEWAAVPTEFVPSVQLQRPSLSQAVANAQQRGGYAFAEEDYTDSYDLLAGLRGANPSMNPKQYPQRQVSIRSATHKYVWCNDRSSEFYNLEADPGERNNLVNTNDAGEKTILRELQDALSSWQSSLEIFPPRAVNIAAKRDASLTDRFKALGYLA
ncbi:MAG: sulfatase [Caldilineaceae bacterium]|nr:sulfatase [Caldilineaceae bacterium]